MKLKLEATWNMKTHGWDQPEPLHKDSACPRCIGGTILRNQLGNEECLNCGHTTRLVIPRRGDARDMAKKPNAPERRMELEEVSTS